VVSANAEGEVVLSLGVDPIRIWIGTPAGMTEFVAKVRELEERLAALEAAARAAKP
jgi:hypothetical protein